jgi:hypothetical protein
VLGGGKRNNVDSSKKLSFIGSALMHKSNRAIFRRKKDELFGFFLRVTQEPVSLV